MKNKRQIIAGAVLLSAGVVTGLGFSGLARQNKLVAEASPASEAPAVKKETFAEERVLKGVSEADLAIIKKIAAQRGEAGLPPQEWVDHVWPKIKKAQAAKSRAVH